VTGDTVTGDTRVLVPAARLTSSVPLLLLAFAGAVVVRVAVAGSVGAASIRAGLVFAVLLAALSIGRVPTPRLGWRGVALGLAGAAVLLVPVGLSVGTGSLEVVGNATGYAGWATATVVVATAEEAFLRGALFGALQRWRGTDVAVVGAAVAFAALHVPLYGWHVVPLDLAVGLALGAVRVMAGTWTAPAIAHVGADLVGWWVV
jgi:membrane protease YdiL (CAAX protease family)